VTLLRKLVHAAILGSVSTPEIHEWKKCNSCKKPIGFDTIYQICSVSSCNTKRMNLTFCSVSCWAAHVPVYRHRDAWALEKRSPTRAEFLRSETVNAEIPPNEALQAEVSMNQPASSTTEKEILIVASKLKDYIRKTSEMNTSAEVLDTLSDKVRILCDRAVQKARQDGRKTVMSRDFVGL
jgi:hypothetical protein